VSLLRVQRFLQQHDEVELSALGLAIATVVTVAEILKNNGLVVLKREPSPIDRLLISVSAQPVFISSEVAPACGFLEKGVSRGQ
jgi:uncharacterized membrane protein YGL010W